MTSKGRGLTWVSLHTLTLMGGLCLFFGRQVLASPTTNIEAADDSALELSPGHSPADARTFQEQTYGPHPQGFARNYRSTVPLVPYQHGPSPFFYQSRASRSSPQDPATAPDRGPHPVEDNTEELAPAIKRSVQGRTEHAQKFPFIHMMDFERAPMAGNNRGVVLVPMNPHQHSFRPQQEDAMLREFPVRSDEKSARTRRSASGSSYQNRVDRVLRGVMGGSEAFSLELLDPEDELPGGNVRERRALRRLDVAGGSPWRQYDVEAVDDDAVWRYFGDDNGEFARRETVKRNVALPEDVVLSALAERDLYESDEEPKVVVEEGLMEEEEEEEQEDEDEEEEEGEAKEEGEVKVEGKHQMTTEKPSFIFPKKAKGKYSQNFKGLGGKMM